MYFYTSTLAVTTALRRSLISMQNDLARGQQELASGRRADLAGSLGLSLGRTLSLGGANEMVSSILATNKIVSARLESTQITLSALSTSASAMRATLLSASSNGGDRQAIIAQAKSALANLISSLNTENGGVHLFAGVNSGVTPVNAYVDAPPSPNKAAIDAAFLSEFGFGQSDPAVASITLPQMQLFLSGSFDSQFSAAGWGANWSNASDQPLRGQIGVAEISETSVTANDPAMRTLAKAYVALSDLGGANMSDEAWRAVSQSALEAIDDAIVMLTTTRAKVGVIQSAVNSSNERMSIQSNMLKTQIDELEGVDSTEAATRVNSLMVQIETSYALTARISQLSLAKYL
ncbi:MAG: flagellar hook-associated family protein [Methylocystis sp.]|nr:flagellar hook-associated family protein [Methylocystis sp.]